MGIRKSIAPTVGVLAAVAALGAAAEAGTAGSSARLPQGSQPPHLNPADFTTRIDNRYWPMKPGSRWIYRETDAEGAKQRVVVTVTHKTRRIANGITARVVHDVVTERGKPVEVTDDWYAQDGPATSGTSASTRPSTGTVSPIRPRARSRPDSTARSPASSCRRGQGSACATGRSTTRATPRTRR